MKSDYSIVRTSDLDESLINSWEKVYHEFPYKYPLRSNWLHMQNPYMAGMPKSIIYVKENDEAVAWTSVIYHQLKVCTQEITASFAIDTFTLDTARGKGYASLLQKSTANDADICWVISLSPANRRVFLKIGFYEGKQLKKYFKVLTKISKKHFFESAKAIGINKKGISRFVYSNDSLVHMVYKLSNYLFLNNSVKKSNSDIQLVKFDIFDKEHDFIYENIKDAYELMVKRDSIYLNWRYNKEPFFKFKKYNIVYDNQIIGYVVYRIGDQLQDFEAVINEFLLLNEYKYLTTHVYQLLEEKIINDGGRTLFIVSSEKEFSSEIENLGFINYSEYIPVIHFTKEFQSEFDFQSILMENSKWYMTFGDQDLDQYRPFQMQPDYSFFLRKIVSKLKL